MARSSLFYEKFKVSPTTPSYPAENASITVAKLVGCSLINLPHYCASGSKHPDQNT
jgi:hypothetical protein